ncbi:hypothetical protein [Segetibacter sp.]|jgi:hypothetical protein|uniref:nSTAND1 domain-containing NTPase n=1 Tax=Segetibacter sp. TaxID=2231182 RepID=UPI0026227522|nr:hypothetical protein [Segetibacter sp.]MCW3078577.1 hypothetical protein [Segetibacter sp.]
MDTTTTGSKFKGLDAYNEKDVNFFHGRKSESEQLYNLVNANPITVLSGKSGTGKTSLLKAGVIPRLSKEKYFPIIIRFKFFEKDPDLVTQVKIEIEKAIKARAYDVDFYPNDSDITLWEYFQRELLWNLFTPILIFDQFEEAIETGLNNKFKLESFLTELSDLVENNIPEKVSIEIANGEKVIDTRSIRQKAKVVLSIREDFLGELETLTATYHIPSARHARCRLIQFDERQATEVVENLWPNATGDNVVKTILEFATKEVETNKKAKLPAIASNSISDMKVEPSLLSQICKLVEEKRVEKKAPIITEDLLKESKQSFFLENIYHTALIEAIKKIEETTPEKRSRKKNDPPIAMEDTLKVFIEDGLVSEKGYRTRFKEKAISGELQPGIKQLKTNYFLRSEDDEIELTNDLFRHLIQKEREERIKARFNRKVRKIGFAIIIACCFIGLCMWGAGAYQAAKALAMNDSLKKDNNILIAENEVAIKLNKQLQDENRKLEAKNILLHSTDPGAVGQPGDSVKVAVQPKDSVPPVKPPFPPNVVNRTKGKDNNNVAVVKEPVGPANGGGVNKPADPPNPGDVKKSIGPHKADDVNKPVDPAKPRKPDSKHKKPVKPEIPIDLPTPEPLNESKDLKDIKSYKQVDLAIEPATGEKHPSIKKYRPPLRPHITLKSELIKKPDVLVVNPAAPTKPKKKKRIFGYGHDYHVQL